MKRFRGVLVCSGLVFVVDDGPLVMDLPGVGWGVCGGWVVVVFVECL